MPTKTDRILDLLPGPFAPRPAPTALLALLGAFGEELLAAENQLARVLQAHWVDHADRSAGPAAAPHDLALLAALYGLAARDDEGVEEFREHLKRHVQTWLGGTVTVRGLLRIAAEAVDLRIDDRNLDAWWRRPDEDLVTTAADGRDAAALVFGRPALGVGRDARDAVLVGSVDLSGGVDVRATPFLRLAPAGGSVTTVDLGAAGTDPEHLTGPDVVAAVAAAVPAVAADLVEGRLRLSAPGGLELLEGDGDAAGTVLGLAGRRFRGADAGPAVLIGIDCPDGLEIAEDGPRFLRVALETGTREIDLGPGRHSVGELATAIDAAFDRPVATVDGDRLVLTSPTVGPVGRVEIAAAAQDAGGLLFAIRLAVGTPTLAARLSGTVDLTGPLDLSGLPALRLLVDGAPVTVGLEGLTSRIALGAAIDAAAGAAVTELAGTGIAVVSPTLGATGEVVLLEPEPAATGDPGRVLFGHPSRRFSGRAAVPGRLTGIPLAAGTDLAARHLLAIGVDGAAPIPVDLRVTAAGPLSATASRAVPPAAIVAAIEARLPGVATLGTGPDGPHLVLGSPTLGATGRIEVAALRRRRRRAFVTRATVIDEAAQSVLGYVQRTATGTRATEARVAGTVDLSRGSDLSVGGWLRLAVDDGPAQEIWCAGPRPRATLDTDVLAAIEAVVPALASIEGGRLVLTSRTPGPAGRLDLDRPRPALRLLGFTTPDVAARGIDGTGVRITGTADLSAGVDLPAGAAIAIAVDGGPVVSIPLTPDGPARVGLDQLVIAVNATLARVVASRDTAHLILRSPTAGLGSRLELAVPAGASDATRAVLGFDAPRRYTGSAPAPARLRAPADLGGVLDLRRARRLLLTVDLGPARPVDLAATAADPSHATVADLVSALDQAVAGVVAVEDGHLVLSSPTTGTASRLALAPDPADDARGALFGSEPETVTGSPAAPPTLVGVVPLEGTVDLSRRSRLRLEVDGRPIDLDIAGPVPGTTSLDEVVAAINTWRPGTAAGTDEGLLRLSGPVGSTRLAVVPLRYLDLTEFLPAPQPSSTGPMTLRQAGSWSVLSASVRPEPVVLRLVSVRGAAEPGIQGPAGMLRVDTLLPPGAELLVVARDAEPTTGPTGPTSPTTVSASDPMSDPTAPLVRAWITEPGGRTTEVAPGDLRVEPTSGHRASDVLSLPTGRSTWRYLESAASRFDHSAFQPPRPLGDPGRLPPATFAGRPFAQRAVFDAVAFSTPARPTVFDRRVPVPDLPVELSLSWRAHRAGTLAVTVPLDLDERFGARFGDAVFAHPDGDSERFPAAVCEPDTDERYLGRLINDGYPGSATAPAVPASGLVHAALVDALPLGYATQPLPFRTPARLTGGGPASASSDGRARIFLSEEGFGGRFLELAAGQPGPAGNKLEVAARPAGPGRFDVTVALRGARFESAVSAVLGGPPQTTVAGLLAPTPVGILMARAGGIAATADRHDAGTR